ncbi:cyclophane-forming radical SAM/SPASM peptide maturase GrrM/OscB [Streptomyces sp. NPDC002888]|uniref:cyclophane-forming radical SAM/SPASM peptide maturase GrrM/OscB n=1 Tax=Streptomyces sp. NPDC002888 TaxID=3364668 RepID=UPI003697BFB2
MTSAPMGRPEIRLAILQPTSLCNLNCTYCYVPDRRNAALMSDEVLEAAASFVFEAAPESQRAFTILWHAGEPLTAGLDFYRRAFETFEAARPRDATVRHSFQTNATLVTDEWSCFFASHGATIGVSVDGPRALHDANRVRWSGKGSFTRTMRGVASLRRHGFDPAAICVLTPTSLQHPDEIYDFFRDEGFPSVGFNVEESEGSYARSRHLDRDRGDTRQDYMRFMRRIWQRRQSDQGRLRIREFDRELAMIRDLRRDPDFVATPDEVVTFANVTIRRDGGISTFAPELASTASAEYDDFVIGSVLADSPADVLSGAALHRLREDLEKGRDLCRRQCAYFPVCGGGYPSNKLAEHGTLEAAETSTCRLHRMALTDVVMTELTALNQHVNVLGSPAFPM